MRLIRISLLVLAFAALSVAAAWAAPVSFFIDSEPVGLGRDVVIDFNPSTLTSQGETPDSIAFLLPADWRFDHRAVGRECTPAQAATVRCPAAAQIGYGHVVIHLAGYLFPGGETNAVAYVTPYLGPPQRTGDPASMVLEVQLLGLQSFVNDANQYLSAKIKQNYSITGRIIALRSGAYGLEASFSGMPGGITVPPELAAAGVTAAVTRFKLQIGGVRRVSKPKIDTVTAPTLSGGTQTLKIHDRELVGYHLLRRGPTCPPDKLWGWELQVGFPSGPQVVKGTVACG